MNTSGLSNAFPVTPLEGASAIQPAIPPARPMDWSPKELRILVFSSVEQPRVAFGISGTEQE
jgi:hypothetical protein